MTGARWATCAWALLLLSAAMCLVALACAGGEVGNADGGPEPSPTPALRDVFSGDTVALHSGISLTVPPGVTGSLALHLPDGMLDHLVLNPEAGEPEWLGLVAEVVPSDHPEASSGPFRWPAIAQSVDGTVEMRWFAAVAPDGLETAWIAVVIRKPGDLVTLFQFGPITGQAAPTTTGEAWAQASSAWGALEVDGASLPARPD